MRRMLALILAVMLFLTACACAAEAQIPLSDAAQMHNALLAAEKINGTVLESGERFSFNSIVGKRTEENGFIPALNGRGVEVVGGGVAQAASALYLALTGLESGSVSFDSLSFYGDRYTGTYVADGSQAVLVDYNNGRDFQFTNLLPGSLSISMAQADGRLVCTVEEIREAEFAVDGKGDRSVPPMIPIALSVQLYCGEDPDVLNNIALAVDSIYDVTLMSGDVFSFNGVVGPREARYGYTEATDGRGEVIMGGGAAQVASALWLLVQNREDIAIVEKATYGAEYNQGYVANASDAILVDWDTQIDFAFRYIGADSLTLYPELNGPILTITAG